MQAKTRKSERGGSRMFGWFHRTDNREQLLARLSEEWQLPAERIAATAAWRSYSDSADSLGVVELFLGLEEELGEGVGGSA
jgi:hypothetical protein